MSTSTDGIPKMTTDCNELFSIFMKIGGIFTGDFETNSGKLYPQNIICNNLHEIHDELRKFETAHIHYPNPGKIIKIDYVAPDKLSSYYSIPFFYTYDRGRYDRGRNIQKISFNVEFDKENGKY